MSDSSTDDDDRETEVEPLRFTWLTEEELSTRAPLGISALPGYDKYRSSPSFRRCKLARDLRALAEEGVQDVFILVPHSELQRLRVPQLVHVYQEAGISVHHFPIEDGAPPEWDMCRRIMCDLKSCLIDQGRKTLVHCVGGLGRSAVVVAVFLRIHAHLTAEEAITRVRQLRGPSAIQTVKQWTFVYEFT